MKRVALLCFTFGLSTLAFAAPCDILPYANQCQGSNLWPVPDGWAADNDGDCQPQPPNGVPRIKGYVASGSYPNFGVTPNAAFADMCAKYPAGTTCWDTGHTGVWGTSFTLRHPPGSMEERYTGQGEICPSGTTTAGTVYSGWSATLCPVAVGYAKPNNGECTARWTSSAKTALQKDPLDPDCDANSCVFDGSCRLR